MKTRVYTENEQQVVSVPTVSDAMKQFLDRHSSHWRPGTVRHHTQRLASFRKFLDSKGLTQLSDITSPVWSEYIASKRATHSETTLHHDGQSCRLFLKECIAQDWIKKSPLDGMKLIAMPTTPIPTPSKSELTEFLTTLKRLHDPKYSVVAKHEKPAQRKFYTSRNMALVLGLMATGCRIGEILDLHLSDVDLVAMTFTFRKTKTKRTRTVPFDVSDPPLYLPILRRYLDRRPKVDSPALFIDHFGQPLTYNAVKCIWQRVRSKCKARFSIHSVRHYALTRLYVLSGDLKAAMTLAGHSSTQTAMRYQERDLTQLKAAMTKANLTEGLDTGERVVRKRVV